MLRGSDIPRLLVAAGSALLLAACADNATAPVAEPEPYGATLPERRAVTVDTVTQTVDSTIVYFTVTPSGGFFEIGKGGVYFSPNSICDPASSYGITEWDKPCSPATEPVTIRAAVGKGDKADARAFIQFDRHLRFVPSDDPSRWVFVYLFVPELSGQRPNRAHRDLLEDMYRVLWRPDGSAYLVDESRTDATLKSHIVWKSGLVYRRVKHFSGFQVSTGFVEEDPTQPIDGTLGGL